LDNSIVSLPNNGAPEPMFLLTGTFLPSAQFSCMNRFSISEMEVADAAHYMGYELMRSGDGYVLTRTYGIEDEVVKVPTLRDVTEFLMH
jgi:hypothetical protein